MKATTTRGATHNYGAPKNWNPETDGECHILQVRVDRVGERRLINCVSTWKPSPEDLAHLNRGGVIELSILSDQPPVRLDVVDPVEVPEVEVPDRFTYDEHGVAAP